MGVVPSQLQMGPHGMQLTLKQSVLNVKMIGGLFGLHTLPIPEAATKFTPACGKTLTFSVSLDTDG